MQVNSVCAGVFQLRGHATVTGHTSLLSLQCIVVAARAKHDGHTS